MPSLRATVPVAAPIEVVYSYLLDRYYRPAHCETSQATKGYVPAVRCLDAEEPYFVRFQVKGRDPLLRIHYGGWQWEYQLQPTAEGATNVTICYRWSWLMSLLGAGTTRAQAANELVETAMALDALGWRQNSDQRVQRDVKPVQTSNAIQQRSEQSGIAPRSSSIADSGLSPQ
jgi:hypothetical protein